jgi:hypothetical protein
MTGIGVNNSPGRTLASFFSLTVLEILAATLAPQPAHALACSSLGYYSQAIANAKQSVAAAKNNVDLFYAQQALQSAELSYNGCLAEQTAEAARLRAAAASTNLLEATRANLALRERQAQANAAAQQAAERARQAQINAGYTNVYGGMANMIGTYNAFQQQNAAAAAAQQQAEQEAQQAEQQAAAAAAQQQEEQGARQAQQQAEAAAFQDQKEAQDAARRQEIANPFGQQAGGGSAANPFAASGANGTADNGGANPFSAPVANAPVQLASNGPPNPFDAPPTGQQAPLPPLGDPHEADSRPAMDAGPCLAQHGDIVNIPGGEYCVIGSTWRHLSAPY